MWRNTDLCQLAFKYGSDKCPQLRKHTYTEYYFDLFKDNRNKIKKIIEIGIGDHPASLLMWQDFFPNAKIYGVDNKEGYLTSQNRIESFLCDQSNKKDLIKLIKKTGSDIDLIIDDASHKPEDQVLSCLTLMPLLKKQVTYIIEDVADPTIVDKLNEYEVEVPPLRQPRKRYDNRLVIVKHKAQTNISFFAKKAFPMPPDGHLARISSIIRAEQVADYIGAKLNPTEGYKQDVCIYVKPPYKPGNDFLFEGKPYLDICEEMIFCELLRKHPEVGVISCSDWGFEILKRILPNKIVNIPQQHCNFERTQRNRSKIKTVGIIGNHHAFEFLPKGLEELLTQRGMKFIKLSKFFTRQDVVNFYLSIDIQIVWRPFFDYQRDLLTNPLKIVNASSFGIPTIAYAEPAFEEMSGCYIPVSTLPEFLTELDNLRSDPTLYDKYAKKGIEKAEEYHIEKIAKLYKDLK